MMSRINTTTPGSRSCRSDNGTRDSTPMPSGIGKAKRSKAKKPKSNSSTVAASGSNDGHQYLGDRKKTAIEGWNDTVPKKSTRPKDVPEEKDPVIQAYLEAKMSLFRNAVLANKQYGDNQDARSVSSTRS